jgi:phosphoenolpyruvate carboxykinase (ATP)
MRILGRELNVKNLIDNPDDEFLRQRCFRHGALITQFGNLAVMSRVKNRSAKFTEIILREPTQEENDVVDAVFAYLKTKEVIKLDRRMCQHPEFNYACRLYVTEGFPRLPLMWGNTMFAPENKDPDFITIAVPEWPDRKVLVFPEQGVTLSLGTDYKGEIKKSMLRQVMYWVKKKGFLGLHAGSKIIRTDKGNGVEDVGFIFFGLSGTGKTSLTCHGHWLAAPEGVVIRQDDVVILRQDGSCIGTEDSFYVKTDGLEPVNQPLIYAACLSPRTILENVMIRGENKEVDFMDNSITSNGRAMVKRSDLAFTDKEVDLAKANNIVFIMRRRDVVPPVMKLGPEWGAAAFMLGESVETSAGDPANAGKSLRVVGTNPFIVGSEAEEGNIFLDILRRNPDINCYIINTGSVGGEQGGAKVTLKETVKIIEMIARDKIEWCRDPFWGYDVPVGIPEVNMERFDLRNFYNQEEIEKRSKGLKAERLAWLEQFEKEGMSSEIIRALKGD